MSSILRSFIYDDLNMIFILYDIYKYDKYVLRSNDIY